jgi:hypothetical protein
LQIKFAHVIELDDLDVNLCPDEFGQRACPATCQQRASVQLPPRHGRTSRRSRLPREPHQQWGDQGEDDTLLYRTALLLEEIEGVTMKKELALLLKKLPIQDVAHLRNEINQPPFGVDTQLPDPLPELLGRVQDRPPDGDQFFLPKEEGRKNPSVELWQTLMEELFFFQYHMHMSKQDCMDCLCMSGSG